MRGSLEHQAWPGPRWQAVAVLAQLRPQSHLWNGARLPCHLRETLVLATGLLIMRSGLARLVELTLAVLASWPAAKAGGCHLAESGEDVRSLPWAL